MGRIIIGGIILLILFIIGRELLCWYWKINKGMEKLDSILMSLENIERHLSKDTQQLSEADKTNQIKKAYEAIGQEKRE